MKLGSAGPDGELQRLFQRVPRHDGTRPRVELGDCPNSSQRRSRARETAAHYTERFRTEGIVGTPRRGPEAKAMCAGASGWWDDNFKHSAWLCLDSNEGVYRTHIRPVLDTPWIEIATADCEQLRDALDAKPLLCKASRATLAASSD